MANQYVNKVNLADGTSIIDISDTTATADKILQGYGAYGKDGAWMNGTASSGYDETLIKNWIERSNSFTTLNWPSGITKIGDFAFANCRYLKPTTLPNTVTTVGQYSFYNCKQINWTSLPLSYSDSVIQTYAFYNCIKLALTSLPSSVTTIGNYTFYSCSALALTSMPSMLKSVNSSAFYNCVNIQVSTLPSTTTYIGQTAFYGCESITSISCSGTITNLGSSAFANNQSLTSASFPNLAVSSLGNVFGSTTASNACQQLEFADIGNAAAIAANSFANCYALETLVIRKTGSICTLANVSAFLNTPMRGYNSLTGTVYVPDELIASYRSATNWSTLYNNGTVNFVKIEGSIYDLS